MGQLCFQDLELRDPEGLSVTSTQRERERTLNHHHCLKGLKHMHLFMQGVKAQREEYMESSRPKPKHQDATITEVSHSHTQQLLAWNRGGGH